MKRGFWDKHPLHIQALWFRKLLSCKQRIRFMEKEGEFKGQNQEL